MVQRDLDPLVTSWPPGYDLVSAAHLIGIELFS